MHRVVILTIAAVTLLPPGASFMTTTATAAPAATADEAVTPSPIPSAADDTPPVTVASGAGSGWRRTAATVRFSATDDVSGVAATYYQVDGGAWTQGDFVVIPAPKDHANDGEHVIAYYSLDNASNAEPVQTVLVRIDTRPPRFRWRSLLPAKIYRVRAVRCRFTIAESTGPVRVAYEVTDQYGRVALRRGGLERAPGDRALRFAPRYKDGKVFVPGVYRVRITLTDEAGNVTVTKRRLFRLYGTSTATAWRRVSGAGKRVALTFDDGGTTPWRSILDTLKAHKAHATFFVLGPYVSSSPSLARRTLAEGHAIGSHGWTHALMPWQSDYAIRYELERSSRPWWSAARAAPMPYMRPPYGGYDSRVLRVSGAAGFTRVILWDVDPQDWASPGSGVIAQRVLSNVRPGSIVVLHLRPQTAAALPSILRGLRSRGYQAVSLPELFRAAGHH